MLNINSFKTNFALTPYTLFTNSTTTINPLPQAPKTPTRSTPNNSNFPQSPQNLGNIFPHQHQLANIIGPYHTIIRLLFEYTYPQILVITLTITIIKIKNCT